MMRADVVNAVLEKGSEAIVLTDSSKFGAVHPYTLGPIERFSRVITPGNAAPLRRIRPDHGIHAGRSATEPSPQHSSA